MRMKLLVPPTATVPALCCGTFAMLGAALMLLIAVRVRHGDNFEGVHSHLLRTWAVGLACLFVGAICFWAVLQASRSRAAFYVCSSISVLMLLSALWIAILVLFIPTDWSGRVFGLFSTAVPMLGVSLLGVRGAWKFLRANE